VSPRVLMACYEVPGYGGASTASYRLFETLQRDGLDVSFLNLIDEQDHEYFRYRFGEDYGNPRRLAGVVNCVLAGTLFESHPELSRTIDAIAPDVLLADDFIATLLLKRASPHTRLIFMTAGLAQVAEYLRHRQGTGPFRVEEFLRAARGGLKVFAPREREAMLAADLIVTHSDLVRDLTLALFPDCSGKVYSKVIWRAEWIADDAKPYAGLMRSFEERDIDAIFVASSWHRPVKNLPLVRAIASRAEGLRLHVVGELQGPLAGATCHGLVRDREALFALLGRSKTLVCPSTFDAAPGILWEASVMGCNIVASRHCGNWMLCDKDLLAEADRSESFADKIALSLGGRREDHMPFFIDAGSYRDLVETITTSALF